MGKKILYKNDNSIINRQILIQSYIDKYFNLYMNNLFEEVIIWIIR